MAMEKPDNSQLSLAVGTWAFAAQAVSCARSELLARRGSLLDVLEKSVNEVEDDPLTGVYVVGRGSQRNAAGKHQFDAAIMEGGTLRFGGVCALEGCSRPISVARRVMEVSPANMLVGDGAGEFARSQGFGTVLEEDLDPPAGCPGMASSSGGGAAAGSAVHDTLGVIVRDSRGRLACGVSTSGPPLKVNGRVGDSALPGCGLYVDDAVGAAVVSGDGDALLRFCPAHDIISRMRVGEDAEPACRHVAEEIGRRLGKKVEMAFLAVSARSGQVGAATTVAEWTDALTGRVYNGFPYAIWTEASDKGPESEVEILVQRPID